MTTDYAVSGMGLIKANEAPTKAQVFSLKDIENHARGIILGARRQADQLLAEAHVVAAEMKRVANDEGLAQGWAEGVNKGRVEGSAAGREQALVEGRDAIRSAVAAFTEATNQLDQQRRELEASALRDVLELAVAIAERVTKRQGELDPAVAVANTTAALRLVVGASDVRIAIHPSNYSTIEEALPKLRLALPTLQHVELQPDPNVTPGGCRLFTAGGEIDADLDIQLRRIAADLVPPTAPEAQ